MKTSKRRTAGILRILRDEIDHLGQFIVLAEEAQQRLAWLSEDHRAVFAGIYRASWRALLIGLAGLLSTDQESITIDYLLEHARNHPYDFEEFSNQAVQERVKDARSELLSLSDLESRLRAFRDRKLAHVDRKHVNDPEKMNNLHLESDEVSKALELVESVVNGFNVMFHGEAVPFLERRWLYRSALNEILTAVNSQVSGK